MKLPLEQIQLDDRCQARVPPLRTDVVEEYAERFTAGEPLPPVEVFEVDGAQVLVDGFHRVAAAATAGVAFLEVVKVGAGSMSDAAWYAAGVNQAHGLRRSNADKQHAVLAAVSNPIGMEQSSRVIAKHVGVSHALVSRIRREWEATQREAGRLVPETITDSAGRKQPRAKSTPKLTPPRVENFSTSPEVDEESDSPFPDYREFLLSAEMGLESTRREAMRALPGHVAELGSVRQRVRRLLTEALAAVRYAIPVECPKCEGSGCTPCGSLGWVQQGTLG